MRDEARDQAGGLDRAYCSDSAVRGANSQVQE